MICHGVSKECLVPVLRELGLRLPTNIDLTGFPFYDPPSDYDARFATFRTPDVMVLRGKREAQSKETTAPPEVTMEDSYPRCGVEKEDGEAAGAVGLHATRSHSSRVSQTPASSQPTSRAASATTSSSTEKMKTGSTMGDDISIPSQTGDIVTVSSGVSTPRGHHKTLSRDDAHSVPDSIASSAKVSYSLDLFVFRLTR